MRHRFRFSSHNKKYAASYWEFPQSEQLETERLTLIRRTTIQQTCVSRHHKLRIQEPYLSEQFGTEWFKRGLQLVPHHDGMTQPSLMPDDKMFSQCSYYHDLLMANLLFVQYIIVKDYLRGLFYDNMKGFSIGPPLCL